MQQNELTFKYITRLKGVDLFWYKSKYKYNAIFVVSHTKQRTKKICWVMFVNYNIFIMHFCSTAIMLIWFCKERIEDTLLNLTKYLWFLKHRCFSYMCFTINTYVIVIHTFFSTVRHYKMNIYSFLQL